ncbi:hypothetical protein DICSQDRAFT_137655 [Dichomitus squalens LYAD-421 SS1]|uniref:Uncharacterized protein n=1 Tax=Dichomitus squalens (strain LYAD-421) TaxID=732165 RepID=R7SVW3_DICSQ|nr:uncharacterized protein DICSQDRAFT_137655 [Dichomitus squalens LYAD-421 SS1]EJF60339.1 hypothetical protein DICSQDRAFT_137655 [Dichomitus squalens LYAD-421 SS1]
MPISAFRRIVSCLQWKCVMGEHPFVHNPNHHAYAVHISDIGGRRAYGFIPSIKASSRLRSARWSFLVFSAYTIGPELSPFAFLYRLKQFYPHEVTMCDAHIAGRRGGEKPQSDASRCQPSTGGA